MYLSVHACLLFFSAKTRGLDFYALGDRLGAASGRPQTAKAKGRPIQSKFFPWAHTQRGDVHSDKVLFALRATSCPRVCERCFQLLVPIFWGCQTARPTFQPRFLLPPIQPPHFEGLRNEHPHFLHKLSEHRRNFLGFPDKEACFPSREETNFSTLTTSSGRPPSHQMVSGPKKRLIFVLFSLA